MATRAWPSEHSEPLVVDAVGRSVVDDDDLQVAHRLRERRGDRRGHQARAIECEAAYTIEDDVVDVEPASYPYSYIATLLETCWESAQGALPERT